MTLVKRAAGTAGFTLLELIVVMAVLSIFLMITAVVSRDAIDMHGATLSRLRTERDAAVLMRQLESDIAQRVVRLDACLKLEKQTGNDRFTLLTQRQGYAVHGNTADRRVSLASYRIEHHSLERAASGYGFGSQAQRPAEAEGTLALARIPADGPLEPAANAFQVIAPGVLRLELSFVVREADKSVLRAVPPADQQQIQALIVTVAIVDAERSRKLTDDQFESIAAQFPDAADDVAPLVKWRDIAANLTRRLPRLPRGVLQQVRVYQGVFTLPTSKPLP
ncbi:MAG: type II secretion system protein [Verrucomicrobia bacterium]|nr:MAG: type II secretion system protein [Verrucomicrobiota bacterium]